jgi:hypothetical protein
MAPKPLTQAEVSTQGRLAEEHQAETHSGGEVSEDLAASVAPRAQVAFKT